MDDQRTTFIFKGYDIDLKQGTADFHYEVRLPDKVRLFSERLTFGADYAASISVNEETLAPILESLLLTLGISYWKLHCPTTMVIEPFTLSKKQAEFWNTVYTKGLGEFYFKNKIDFRGLVNFPYSETKSSSCAAVPLTEGEQAGRSLLLFGGGKDSLVSAELLKAAKKSFSVYTLNDYPFQHKAIEELGAEHINMKRELDAQILSPAGREGTYKGHVPVSLIYAFTAALACAIYGYEYVVASNEETASYGNTTYLGMEINHQWSKSLECERLVQNYLHSFVDSGITYFSLLRPFKEIDIMRFFSRYPQYFRLFVSCNRNFTAGDHGENFFWCGMCPKCLFVFALMAAFISKKELVEIFGQNLFADPLRIPLYKELLGLEAMKPFECVGTPEETQVAFYRAYKNGEYRDDAVMQMFSDAFSKNLDSIAAMSELPVMLSTSHLIPQSFQPAITYLCQ
jgi:hypothetical protein